MNFIIQLIDNSLFPIVTFELSKNLKLATDEQLRFDLIIEEKIFLCIHISHNTSHK